MQVEEIKKLEGKKLNEALIEKRKHLFKVEFDIHNGHAKNTHEIRKAKKDIARIKTVMQSKTLNPQNNES